MANPNRAETGRLGLPIAVGVIGLTLITAAQAVPNRISIEDDLTTRSTSALAADGLDGFRVSFSGRDATIVGSSTGSEAERAIQVVEEVEGVRIATVSGDAAISGAPTTSAPTPSATTDPAPTTEGPPAASPAPEPSITEPSITEPSATEPSATEAPDTEGPATGPSATGPSDAETTPEATDPSVSPAPAPIPVGFTLTDGAITVTGTVRSEADRAAVIEATEATAGDWFVVDRLRIDSALVVLAPARDRLTDVTALLSAAPKNGSRLVIQYRGDSVILRGAPSDAGIERALLRAAEATVADPSQVIDGLDVGN